MAIPGGRSLTRKIKRLIWRTSKIALLITKLNFRSWRTRASGRKLASQT